MKKNTLSNFRKDEGGGILAFTLLMFLVMLVGGGMAVDFINYEYRREGVQDALDRGVLAAAALGKDARATSIEEIEAAEAAAIETVYAYVRSGGYDPDAIGVVVTPDFTLNSQLVAAISDFSVDTYFLRMTGIDTLNGGAAATALIQRNQIELSLVVDISGSMRGSKIIDLREAATNFVTDMLSDDRADYTSISLVPFSGQVSAGRELMDRYNLARWHEYSNCADMTNADYLTTELLTTAELRQTQHFSFRWIYDRNSDWCPREDISIHPWSNRLGDLTTRISSLRATGQTATYLGMKWGTALLDPSARPALTSLSQDCTDPVISNEGEVLIPSICEVDPAFDGRPVAYSDTDTLKFIILMTDGANTTQYKIKNSVYRVARDEYGNLYPMRHALNAQYWDSHRPDYDDGDRSSLVSGSEGDTLLQNICTRAKNAGIVVFTIGYDVNVGSNPYTQMRTCASTFGHFYNVETDDLNAAFSSISQTIQKLKLIN